MPPIPNIPLQYYNFTKKLNSFFVFYYIFLLQKRCIPTIEYIFSTLILQFKLCELNYFCFLQLLGKCFVHPNDRFAKYKSHKKCNHQEDAQFCQIYPVIVPITASNRFPQGCHTVRKRQKRIHSPEKFRSTFNRESSTGSRNLHNK